MLGLGFQAIYDFGHNERPLLVFLVVCLRENPTKSNPFTSTRCRMGNALRSGQDWDMVQLFLIWAGKNIFIESIIFIVNKFKQKLSLN